MAEKKRIRIRCPACNAEPDVAIDQVVLTWPEDAYAFRCPACGDGVTKDAPPGIRELLKRNGVVTVGAPPEHPEKDWKRAADAGPPLTLDDMIDFHRDIDVEIDRLLAGGLNERGRFW
jgi:uncharacterized Zn finger protein